MPIPPRLLQGVLCEYPIDRLLEMTPVTPTLPEERRLLGLVLPPWQRGEVWSPEQKRKFVEGIFLGLGCGFYVTNGLEWDQSGNSSPMSGWLIDGQQRISALRDFINGNLVVFEDVSFPDLSRPERLRFLRTPFPCFELHYSADERLLAELYNRLNFGGTPHAEQDRVDLQALDQDRSFEEPTCAT